MLQVRLANSLLNKFLTMSHSFLEEGRLCDVAK